MKDEDQKILLELWDKIKKWREELWLSQSDLAKQTGIDRSYISMVERGKTNVTYLMLKRIEKILGNNFIL